MASGGLSARCSGTVDKQSFLTETFSSVSTNEYDPAVAQTGIVNLGTADVKVVEDELIQQLSKFPAVTKESLYYFRLEGITSFLEALAEFFQERFYAAKPINPFHISVLPGASSCLDFLAYCLADDGDCFLCPYPYYSRISNDMQDKSKVITYGISLTSKMEEGDAMPFQLTVKKVEKAFNEAKAKGLVVRGIVLTNPNNPLCVLYSEQLLMDILNFAKRHKLHVISDEVYALSLFNTNEKFTSILSLESIPDPDRTHMIWAFSKDFGISGFRCATVYSMNEKVHQFFHNTAVFGCVPYIVQDMMEKLIRDKAWLDNIYFPTLHERMRENYAIFADCFKKLSIPIYEGCGRATCFIWVNFSKYTHPLSAEGELSLFRRLMDAGVYVVPGSKLGCEEYGWFRIVFTNYKDHCEKAVERMENVFTEMDKEPVPEQGSAVAANVRTVCLDDLGLGELSEALDLHLGSCAAATPGGDSGGSTADDLDLADLVGVLKTQIRQSDWLEVNTPEKFEQENPEIAAIFRDARQAKQKPH